MAIGGPLGFGGFNQTNQAALLQQQVTDQLQAQAILRQIGQQQQAFNAGFSPGPQLAFPPGPQIPFQNSVQSVSTYHPPGLTHARPMNFMQMKTFMTGLMNMMIGIAQLGNGFSSFMGGPQQHYMPASFARAH